MAPLRPDIRRELERAILRARDAAEQGARSALTVLGVTGDRAFDALSQEERAIRTALRARMRALAPLDRAKPALGEPVGYRMLVEEIAYEHWHRMLFARFLERNHLLIHPSHGVAVTLDECADLAQAEGEPDEWMVAAKFASAMLPGLFRGGDPALALRFAANDRVTLEAILKSLPEELFTADDAIGWVYQFWQAKARDEVNASGRKVGGADIAPVTQLFTDHYMVEFLLQNSLGAWWAANHPDSALLEAWSYLRRLPGGQPAAGAFEGWPRTAAEVSVMDPCCGSGHFLVAAGQMLRAMRIEEEGLSPSAAAEVVLMDNLFGLELDLRCTQLAAFTLALDAWKAGMDPRIAKLPNVACSGLPVSGQFDEWRRLAQGDVRLEETLRRLYELFKNAPDLGSLINPTAGPAQLRVLEGTYAEVAPLLAEALRRMGSDPVAEVFGMSAEGAGRAAALLARKFTLVTTNVPYLGFNKMDSVLKDYVAEVHKDAKNDLATAFVDRIGAMVASGGAHAVVAPQAWRFLGSYKHFRRDILSKQKLRFVASLGARAFDSISGEVVNVALLIAEHATPDGDTTIEVADVSSERGPDEKAAGLRLAEVQFVIQRSQLQNPDARLTLGATSAGELLSQFAESFQGMSAWDRPRFVHKHWEHEFPQMAWIPQQSTVDATCSYGGLEHVVLWEEGAGRLKANADSLRGANSGEYRRGVRAWGKRGVVVSQMGHLPSTLYTGTAFDTSAAVIIPRDPGDLPAIWAYCSSPEFQTAVRRIDQKLNVTNATMVKVPFDLDHWAGVAKDRYPAGLPEKASFDPAEWYFRGRIEGSRAPLQVAVARLLGYRWPLQDADGVDDLATEDGVLCLPALAGYGTGAERLRKLLAGAYGDRWDNAALDGLLGGSAGQGLEGWLGDQFFEHHCRLFHNRPFIWHIWDGRRDGFSALLNYHRLDAATLRKVAFTYLGAWIERQREDVAATKQGADDRLAAALDLQRRLNAILGGEAPLDIYVRWKKTEQQAIGWAPDLDDGVRINIRPFITAGVLRSRVNINWAKDRGKNADGTDRLNDLHLSIADKTAARQIKQLAPA